MRSEIGDNRILPVENLATNPSFERVISGGTVVRRNYKINPTPASTSGYSGANGATLSFISAPYAAIEFITPISGTADSGASLYTRDSWLPGEVWTISFDLEAITADTYRWTWTGGGMGSFPAGIVLSAGEKRRISYTFTVMTQGNGVVYFVRSTASQSQTFRISRILVEKKPSALPYFDGSTTDNTGMGYSWEGTANASTSVAKAGVVEVRRNLLLTPNPIASGINWSSLVGGTGATVSGAYNATGGPNGEAFWRATKTADGTGSSWLRNVHGRFAITTGTTYTFSGWIRSSATSRQGVAIIRWFNSSGTVFAESPSTAATLNTNTWVRLYVTATAPADSVTADFSTGITAGSVSGESVDSCRFIVEQSSIQGAYFDGDTTPDADLVPSWTGTTNGSASTLSGVTVSGASSNGNGYGRNFLSWAWADLGKSSVRTVSDRSSISDTFVSPGGLNLNAFAFNMKPGHTYTAIAKLRLTGIQGGTPYFSARKIEAACGTIVNSWSGVTYVQSNAATNAAGIYTLRLTFTVPSNAVWAAIRLYNGTSQGNGDAWWDSFMLVEGVYKGTYIDGDMPNCIWRGTPHNSTSAGYPSSV